MVRRFASALLASMLALPSVLPAAAAAMTVNTSASVQTETNVTSDGDDADVETTTEVKTTTNGEETTVTKTVKKGPCADKTGTAKVACLRENRGQMIKKTCENKTGQDRSDCVRTIEGRTTVRAITKMKKGVNMQMKEENPNAFKKLKNVNRMMRGMKEECATFDRGSDEFFTCQRKAVEDLSTLRTHDLKGRLSRRSVEAPIQEMIMQAKICRAMTNKDEMRACLQKLKKTLTGSEDVEVKITTEE